MTGWEPLSRTKARQEHGGNNEPMMCTAQGNIFVSERKAKGSLCNKVHSYFNS
jgi:hypothetical protein